MKHPDKVVKPGWAAKVLSIDLADLPRLDRAWTKRDVKALKDERPEWLTDARRRYGAEREARAAARAAELDAALMRLGYTAPDEGSERQAVFYVDAAMCHLMHETGCSEDEADSAAWRRWPASMSALDDEEDEDELFSF